MHHPQYPRSPWSIARRVLPYLKPYRLRMGGLTVLLLLQTLASLWIPFLLTIYAVDKVLLEKDWSRLMKLGGIYGVLFLVAVGAYLLNRYLIYTVGSGIVRDLRRDLYRHIHELDLSFVQYHPAGDLISRVLNDVGGVQGLLTSTVLTVLSQLILGLSAIYLVVSRSWKLTLLSALLVPFIILVTRFFNRRARVLSMRLQEQLAVVTRSLQEAMAGMRLIKTLSRESLRVARFTDQVQTLFSLSVKRGMVEAYHSQATAMLVAAGGIVVLIAGVREIQTGAMTPGTLFGFFFVLGRAFYGPVTAFASLNIQIQSSLACLDRILEVLDATPLIVDAPDARRLTNVRGHVSFRGITFSYEQETPVLRDFSLEVRPGEAVAMFGPSGAGKTTVLNLLCRFYDPQEGAVLVDGVDLRELRLDDLRSHIAYVDQDTFLFNASVAENLQFARPSATLADLEAACKAALIHDVIQHLPDGYDTVLGEQGARLSGGEKQRISIARAILRDAPIIVFDEATSALDSTSERLVQEALRRLLHGRTSITIAHRIGTIRAVDRIVVMERGRVLDEGNCTELLRRCEPFRRFWSQQFGEAIAPTTLAS
ncbi:ABC transporter ATP-binding protein [Candidatus Fermentibacteria bacterium]|nr:ABC transporter ATP-binding protein [Candidatus Fermentibacteria bacterium]